MKEETPERRSDTNGPAANSVAECPPFYLEGGKIPIDDLIRAVRTVKQRREERDKSARPGQGE